MAIPATAPLWFINGSITIALARADNADQVSVLVHRMAEGDTPPDHVHHGEDETFHILEGELVLRIGDMVRTARAGDTILAPRDVPHAFTVTSPGGARFLTITRGGFEDLVREMGRPAPNDCLPLFAVPSPEMRSRLAERCAAHGITLLDSGAVQGEAFAA